MVPYIPLFTVLPEFLTIPVDRFIVKHILTTAKAIQIAAINTCRSDRTGIT